MASSRKARTPSRLRVRAAQKPHHSSASNTPRLTKHGALPPRPCLPGSTLIPGSVLLDRSTISKWVVSSVIYLFTDLIRAPESEPHILRFQHIFGCFVPVFWSISGEDLQVLEYIDSCYLSAADLEKLALPVGKFHPGKNEWKNPYRHLCRCCGSSGRQWLEFVRYSLPRFCSETCTQTPSDPVASVRAV